MRKQGMSENDLLGEMTCCNVVFFKMRTDTDDHVLLNDVITGKPVLFCDDNRDDSELWRIFMECERNASVFYPSGISGSVILIGNKSEDADHIVYDWTDYDPVISFMAMPLRACYVTVENGQYRLADNLTSKRLVFENLNGDNSFRNRLDTFYATESLKYMHVSGRCILVGAEEIAIREDEIILDATRVYAFSDYETLYYIIYGHVSDGF